MMVDPQQDLARRAGLDLPSITPLVLGIAVYAIVLGPIVYFVLRRMRRLTLGWFVIPVVAVLTAGGVAVAGGGALRNGNPATATFLQDVGGGRLCDEQRADVLGLRRARRRRAAGRLGARRGRRHVLGRRASGADRDHSQRRRHVALVGLARSDAGERPDVRRHHEVGRARHDRSLGRRPQGDGHRHERHRHDASRRRRVRRRGRGARG